MFKLLRKLRHGPLKFLGRSWVCLGNAYRFVIRWSEVEIYTKHFIGSYGPFKIDSYFAFSNFSDWGKGHNNGFEECIKACHDKKCFIDVGAHIGLVSIPASTMLLKEGAVIAIEPATANFNYLSRHVQINNINNINLYNCLIGSDDHENVNFYEMMLPSGMNSSVNINDSLRYRKTHKKQLSLDSLCNDMELLPDVIKIDVEGYEFEVLSGAKSILSKCKPLIFLSVHPNQLRKLGTSVEQLSILIAELGYSCNEIDGSIVNKFRLAEYVLTPLNLAE